MFVVVENRDAAIVDYWERASGTNVWVPSFVRDSFLDDDSQRFLFLFRRQRMEKY